MSGHSKIPMRREYLNKEACLQEARRLLQEGTVHSMSDMQVAREIYFHAAIYYLCEKTGLFPTVREHTGIIDLHDGGDKPIRRAAYAAYWKMRKKGE